MKFYKDNKTTILAGILVLAAVYVYFNFFGGGGSTALTSSSGANSPVSQDLLLSLTTLNTLELDNSIFTNEVFLSLSDFGVQIPDENVGRRNPFAPVGSN